MDGERAGTAGDDVLRLGRVAKAWRAGALAVVAALFLAGTAIGDDPWWPFGPWRMFSTSTAPTGAVAVLAIEVRSAGAGEGVWRPAPLTLSTVGLNRAEVEGRVPQMLADPSLLGTLARTHARLRPQEPAWTAVRVVRVETVIVDRRPTGEQRRTVLVSWPDAPGTGAGALS